MVNALDRRFSRAARRTAGGNGTAERLAALGSPRAAIAEGLAAAAILRACGRPAARVALAAPAAELAGAAVKRLLPRPRPAPKRFRGHGRQSLPSTHVASMVAMLWCLWRAAPSTWSWRIVLAAASALGLGLAVERVAAGAHWPSDVVAGAGIGAATGWALTRGPAAGKLA